MCKQYDWTCHRSILSIEGIRISVIFRILQVFDDNANQYPRDYGYGQDGHEPRFYWIPGC